MSNRQVINKIKEELNNGHNQIDALRNKLKGKTALIISAGPSAKNWKKIFSEINDESLVVVCVKQTIDMDDLSDLCDLHFINPFNLKKYKVNNALIILSTGKNAPKLFLKPDVTFEICDNSMSDFNSSLASTCEFEKWTLNKTGNLRPWGPGIIHESVLFSLVHMGVSKIVTVGWDIADSAGGNKHFDEKESFANRLFKLTYQYSPKIKLKRVYDYFLYNLGKKYNLLGMPAGEAQLVKKSIPSLKEWLLSKDISLEINSNSKWMTHED
jgi:hypothetical protein